LLRNIKFNVTAHRSFNINELKNEYIKRNYELQKQIYVFPNLNVSAVWLKNDHTRIFLSQYNGSKIYEEIITKKNMKIHLITISI